MVREDRSRQVMITESSDEQEEFQVDHIKVGSYYEIDHSKLPPTSPVQLQMVKIVMVCGKNDRVMSVRYPSIFSLKSYFRSNGNSGGGHGSRSCGSTISAKLQKAMKLNPALDEKYSMVNRVAALALFRHIKPDEFVISRGSMTFWAANQSSSASGTTRGATRSSSSSGGKVIITSSASRGSGDVAGCGGSSSSSGVTVYQRSGTKTVDCMSALKLGKMANWGKRQKVKYVSNCANAARNDSNPQVITPPNEDKSVSEEQLKWKEQTDDESSDDGKDEEEEKGEEVKQEVKEEDGDDEDDKGVGDEEMKPKIPLRRNRKRKCKVVSYNQQSRNPKKPKREIIARRKMVLTRGQKSRGRKEAINRWSADRYKLAEENILKIMKEKGAVFEKPILRQKLRDEARKVIGDTGLLDHLLKHMAGKVAPGGGERFRRRHNADGAMEYWLESADLVEIRKMAGVSDPYWQPPLGWKLGDNPSQDPVCAVEIRQLKEEVDKLKRDLNELQMTWRPAEAEIVATTPLSCVSEQNMVNDLEVLPLKEWREELVKRKFKLEQHMIKVSHYLTEMEEEMEKLSKLGKPTSEGSDGTTGCLTLNVAAEGNNDNDLSQPQLQVMDSSSKQNDPAEAAVSAAKAEEKAAKLQRLKSGFRICKPQGTSFKWPNIPTAGDVVLAYPATPYNYNSSISSSSSHQILSPPTNLDDYYIQLAAQTPPSVSSTTTRSPSLPIINQQTIPVKLMARRLAAPPAIPLSSYLPSLITGGLNYAPGPPAAPAAAAARTNLAADSTTQQHYWFNIPAAIYSHSQQRSNQNLAMIPTASASNKVQEKYTYMSPKLAAERSRVVAYAYEKEAGVRRTSSQYSANTSPSAVATTN